MKHMDTHVYRAKQPGNLGYYIPIITLQKTHFEYIPHWFKTGDGATGNGVKTQERFLSECKMASLTNTTLKLMVHRPQHLKTHCREFEKDMAHERTSVTAWMAEFLSWGDTGLLYMFSSKTHTNA